MTCKTGTVTRKIKNLTEIINLRIPKINKESNVFMLVSVTLFIEKQPPEMFCKKGGLKIFTKFTGKHLCWSLFF